MEFLTTDLLKETAYVDILHPRILMFNQIVYFSKHVGNEVIPRFAIRTHTRPKLEFQSCATLSSDVGHQDSKVAINEHVRQAVHGSRSEFFQIF